MKKNDVFTFTAPNGVEVTAVVIDIVASWYESGGLKEIVYLCYAQNRLFTWKEELFGSARNSSLYGRVVAEYAILPDYDNMLELHQAMDYPTWEQNMEKPDPDEGEDIFWDSCAEEHNKQEDV